MINQDELKLLLALLNTIDKHGLEKFHSLSKKLTGSDSLDFSFLNEAISKRKKLKSQSKPDYVVKTEEIIKKMDNDKKVVVIDLITLIKRKSVLKNLSDFSTYLNANGIQTKQIRSWHEGIYRIAYECFHKDMSFINKLSEVLTDSKKDDRSLARWSEIILKPKNVSDEP
ncbi:hypothetical protein [Pseudoalteromonas porphyrae]|uniref:Uncharacterized protein n=1 Tax=Pseudoalteromonas porphyrae TaxID=187330 RepID=A0A0N1EGJ3_9GAMM|nr:hypothetical protein [Pseudoalteromonas porphyrae]KPH57995.1 hypothetical protein ADS77_18235 [Pseudoalteromonas porphyrae]